MGDCRDIFEQLSAYLDAELSPETCREIEVHLAGCGPCEDFLASLRKTVELCRGGQVGVEPRQLSPEVRQRLLAVYQKMLAQRGGSVG